MNRIKDAQRQKKKKKEKGLNQTISEDTSKHIHMILFKTDNLSWTKSSRKGLCDTNISSSCR